MRASACCSWAVCRPSEQHLDHSDIDVLLEQMGGEAVPQGVQRYTLVDPGHIGCGMTGAIELACRHRLHPVAPWKQPALRSSRPPPAAQQFEQMWRQHHVPVFAAFALFDADDHALAVDVADLERDHLGGAQACAISHTQRGLVFAARRRIQQPRHLLRAEHDRQFAGLVDERRVLDDVGAPERDPEEEQRSGHGGIENRKKRGVRRQMQLKASDVLEARWVFGANLRIVMSSIKRRRNGLMASLVMGMLLSWVKVANPSSQDRTSRRAIVLAVPPAAAPYRASGLVLWHETDVAGAGIMSAFWGNADITWKRRHFRF